MTNKEHVIEQLKSMTEDEFCDFIFQKSTPWCNGKECGNRICGECRAEWANAEYIAPMPKLENKMFVIVDCVDHPRFGVIVDNIVVYDDGGFDYISNILDNITHIYKSNCFNFCNNDTLIWAKA